MQLHQLLSQDAAQTRDAQDPSLSKSNLRQEALSKENVSIITTPDPTLFVAPIVLLAMAGVAIVHKLKQVAPIPQENSLCQNCRYLSQNKYLKCAVQPTKVLTNEAKHCCNYQPRNQKISRFWQFTSNKDS